MLSASPAAHADTVDFIYNGVPVAGSGVSGDVVGTGSFSFAGPASTVSLATLSSFNFSFGLDFSGENVSYADSLVNLVYFFATLTGDTLLKLNLSALGVTVSNP